MARKSLSLKELSNHVGGVITGDSSVMIHGAAGLKEAGKGEITFLSNPRYANLLGETQASAVILSRPDPKLKCAQIVVENTYYAFALILRLLVSEAYQPAGVSSQAFIGDEVRLGRDLSILPFVAIERGAEIGDRVVLYPGVFIGAGSKVGSDTVVHSNASIREKVSIGERVIIHSGVVIGSDGFGFATHQGSHHKIPQIGTVIIEDDVEIGANATVDRAAMGKTVIGRGTKIDNQVQIAHNVEVGEHCLLVSQVGISGSTVIGNYVTLAGQTGVAGHLTIGDHVVAGGRSGVTKDVGPNQVVSGYPALPHRQWLEAQVIFGKLPELRKRIKALEIQLEKFDMEKQAKAKKGDV